MAVVRCVTQHGPYQLPAAEQTHDTTVPTKYTWTHPRVRAPTEHVLRIVTSWITRLRYMSICMGERVFQTVKLDGSRPSKTTHPRQHVVIGTVAIYV